MPISSQRRGGPAEHLFVQDAAIHPAQEHKVADGGHVDPSCQQVHGHRNDGICFVAKATDQLQRLVRGPRNFENGIVIDVDIPVTERVFQQSHHHVGMDIGRAEDQRLIGAGRIEMIRQCRANDAVERFGNHFAVEFADFEVKLIRRPEQIDPLGLGVVDRNVLTRLVVDTAFAQLGANAQGGS